MRAADSRPYDVSPRRFKTARPGGRALQKGRNPLAWAGEDTRPYGKTGNGSFFLWGLDTGRPVFRATARAAPTAENGPGAFARQGQAQLWNRSSSNFCKPRAQWPGGNLNTHSNFARRKFCKIQQVRVPRNGGPGADFPCQGEMARRARGGRERPAWRTQFAPAASPGDPQGELPRRGKRRWPGPLGTFPSCRFTMQVQQ